MRGAGPLRVLASVRNVSTKLLPTMTFELLEGSTIHYYNIGKHRYHSIRRYGFNEQPTLSQSGHDMLKDDNVGCSKNMTPALCKPWRRFFIQDRPNPSLNR